MSAFRPSNVSSIYYNKKSILTLDISNVYLYNFINQKYMYDVMSSYTNLLLKTEYVGTRPSMKHKLVETKINTLDFRQIMNIPSGNYIRVSYNLDDNYNKYLDSITLNDEYVTTNITNFVVNLNVNNEYGELFGYCNELVDLTFERK